MPNKLLRSIETAVKMGRGRTRVFTDVNEGLITRPVKDGRNSLWPEAEIDQILLFRIAGKSDDDIRHLVDHLHQQRQEAVASITL